MKTRPNRDRSRLIGAAMQQIPCDLTVTNIQLVNVITGEIYPAEVDVLDGVVVRVRTDGEETALPARETYDGGGNYLIPGFIDTHMHVESTMMTPEHLGRAIVPWGTTTACIDPHEIANVQGVEGVRFMLDNSRKAALRQYLLAPSCVPAVPGVENAGAAFGAEEVGELLDLDGVVGIAEIMDFVGVIRDDGRMHSIVDEGLKRGVYLQGHAPFVTGKELAAYRLGGPDGDHESNLASEVREKLRNGMHINLRASSLVDKLTVLLEGFRDHPWRDFVSFCTDDVHAGDLLTTGHINYAVGKAIAAGFPPVEVIKWATLNAAREYGWTDLGAIAPGYLADMQIVKELDGARPLAVFIEGRLAAEGGAYLAQDDSSPAGPFHNSMQLPELTEADFRLPAPEGSGDTVRVAAMVQERDSILHRLEWVELPVVDGSLSIDGREDLSYLAVFNRHGTGGRTVAVLKDGPLREGAFATTVSHDNHNLTLVYKTPGDALSAANALAKSGGGFAAVKGGELLRVMPLPVAGLMASAPCDVVAAEIEAMQAAVDKICGGGVSLLHVASMRALPCLPGIAISDCGLVDGRTQRLVDPFAVDSD